MKRLIKLIILVAIFVVSVYAGYYIHSGYKLYKEAVEETPITQMAENIKNSREHYTEYKELPQNYIDAVVAVEDRRFFEHRGIDLVSIGRAIVTNIRAKELVEGGSTITQQLAKNTYFSQRRELVRKIAETFTAHAYEKELTKEKIFELYVNTMYFGDGYYSIYDASHGYFDKEVKDMDLFECTLLAGIPNAPSVYSPTVNPELSRQRHEQVLRKMVKYNYLTQDEADEVLKHYDENK